MNFKRIKSCNKIRTCLFGGIFSILLLISVVLICRSYAIYEETKNLDVIQGSVPNQFYDMMVSFSVMDDSGNKTYVEEMPEGKNWNVSVDCDKGASGSWDYENWRLIMHGITKTRTKCNLIFRPYTSPLSGFGIYEHVVDVGEGLYEISHQDADITANLPEDLINNLRQTEYRYAGANPNNFVLFNNELWRIIGLVNTPNGSRLKIVRNATIGRFSWDSSASNINGGWGVNEWSESKLMKLLNEEAYYNRSIGSCYTGPSNATSNCNFSETGLTNEAKKMIYSNLWLLGTNGEAGYYSEMDGLTKHFYNFERANRIAKQCSSGTFCNDTVSRGTAWRGNVGLIYPSDYGYAMSGEIGVKNRNFCLNQILINLREESYPECTHNNWLLRSGNQWLMIPMRHELYADYSFYINPSGYVNIDMDANANWVYPTVHLKDNIVIQSGEGTREVPYVLGVR